MIVSSVQHPWATDLAYEALGVTSRVRSTDLELGRSLDELLQMFPKTSRRPEVVLSLVRERDRYQVFDQARVRVGDGDRDRALMTVLRANNSEVISRTGLMGVHSGVVARSDRVIAFPGRSGTGKSTFVAACLRAGFDYVSDEVLAVDPVTGTIVPYPKPLWLSRKARTALGIDEPRYLMGGRVKSPVLAGELGAEIAIPPLRVTDMLILYEGADPPTLAPVQPADLGRELMRCAFHRFRRAEAWFHTVARLVRSTQAWNLTFTDPARAAELVARSF